MSSIIKQQAFLSVIPLISSSILMTYGLVSLVTMPPLKKLPSTSVATLFRSYFRGTLTPIILSGATAGTVGAFMYLRRGGNSYYGIGSLLAFCHFMYVPFVMYPCQAMLEANKDQPESVTQNAISKWLRFHKVRLVSDVLATVCFTLALTTDQQ